MVKVNIIDTSHPAHLGGHENETHIDEGAADYLIKKFGIKSVIDVGCGPGGMAKVWEDRDVDWVGIDGDFEVSRDEHIRVKIHDYASAPYVTGHNWDLGWTVEFLEHVEAKYIPNYMATLQECRYVICTHAFPNQPGHHHVLCRDHQFWVDMFSVFGFEVDPETTNEIRQASTMKERYMKQQSLFFRNRSLQ